MTLDRLPGLSGISTARTSVDFHRETAIGYGLYSLLGLVDDEAQEPNSAVSAMGQGRGYRCPPWR
jgi:hypothetical protein